MKINFIGNNKMNKTILITILFLTFVGCIHSVKNQNQEASTVKRQISSEFNECPNDSAVEYFDGTVMVELTQALDLRKFYKKYDSGEEYYEFILINGKIFSFNSYYKNFQRSFGMMLSKNEFNSEEGFRTGILNPPFRMVFNEVDRVYDQVTLKNERAQQYIFMNTAGVDIRDPSDRPKITFASLKYNLGNKFKVTCAKRN